MYWRIQAENVGEERELTHADGRFVLHRHWDSEGAHLDLRLEAEGCLIGWRINGEQLSDESLAVEKGPHPLWWLENNGNAIRMDNGVYAWEENGKDGGLLLLKGREGVVRVRVDRERLLPVAVSREVRDALGACGAEIGEAAALIRDGVTARHRAVERFCGLGRELDGRAFEDGAWRKMLSRLSLDEIHAQLRTLEVRFDEKYPPLPVSQPESLAVEKTGPSGGPALSILHGEP